MSNSSKLCKTCILIDRSTSVTRLNNWSVRYRSAGQRKRACHMHLFTTDL